MRLNKKHCQLHGLPEEGGANESGAVCTLLLVASSQLRLVLSSKQRYIAIFGFNFYQVYKSLLDK